MPKGLFCQTVCLLTDGTTTLDEVLESLRGSEFVVLRQTTGQKEWHFGGPSLIILYCAETNGTVGIDLLPQSWPDSMGDAKSDLTLFGAWSLGQFGPFTYPQGLARARHYGWMWQEGSDAAARHTGVIRVRMTYVGGSGPDAPVAPKDRSATDELNFLTRLVLTIGACRGVICYFNPNGETLQSMDGIRATLDECEQQKTEPLDLWCNLRYCNIDSEFALLDTVGNGQLDVPDVEAVFSPSEHQPSDIASFLRGITRHVMHSGQVLSVGTQLRGVNGDDDAWVVEQPETSLMLPPRRVLRVAPRAHAERVANVVKQLQAGGAGG